jgi:hypothetical protein
LEVIAILVEAPVKRQCLNAGRPSRRVTDIREY